METDSDDRHGFPDAFWPKGEWHEKERFAVWWLRVKDDIPTVPRNVAKQWLHEHKWLGPFTWLPLARCRFVPEMWSREQVLAIRYDNEHDGTKPREERRGDWQLRQEEEGYRNTLARAMARRDTWPVPPIVLDNHRPAPDGGFQELPRGFVLIEGHSRFGIARALATRGALAERHCLWLITVDPEESKNP